MTVLAGALLILALLLVLAEAHLSTGGVIGAGAIVAAVAGLAVLLDAVGASLVVALVIAICVAASAVAPLLVARRRILRPLHARPRTGREALVGHVGVVRSASEPQLEVFVDGTLWRAEPDPIHRETDLHDGDRVVVERVNGLTLRVRRAEDWELSQ